MMSATKEEGEESRVVGLAFILFILWQEVFLKKSVFEYRKI